MYNIENGEDTTTADSKLAHLKLFALVEFYIRTRVFFMKLSVCPAGTCFLPIFCELF